MRYLALCLVLVGIPAGVVDAVVPATEAFLPSVGRGQGQCPGGICSMWRTDVWLFNADPSVEVAVEISFLRRNADNLNPASVTVGVGPGETLELADILADTFGLDGAFGAFRFAADGDVVVTGRIYDSNVQTNIGVGTAGQFFPALPASFALAEGESTDLIGLARDNADSWRTNFGFVETTGQAAEVLAELIDSDGTVLSSKTYALSGFGTGQTSIADIGGPGGENLRVRIRVSEGPGRVLTFASRIDNRTGDPSTVEMVTALQNRQVGSFEGIVMTPDGLRIDGGIELAVNAAGLTDYAGVTGIPCGDQLFTVDFGTPPVPPIPLQGGGIFSTVLVMPYIDAGIPIFTIEWTLSGTLSADGVMTGVLQSVTSEGLGAWSACDGTAVRTWRAGWVER